MQWHQQGLHLFLQINVDSVNVFPKLRKQFYKSSSLVLPIWSSAKVSHRSGVLPFTLQAPILISSFISWLPYKDTIRMSNGSMHRKYWRSGCNYFKVKLLATKVHSFFYKTMTGFTEQLRITNVRFQHLYCCWHNTTILFDLSFAQYHPYFVLQGDWYKRPQYECQLAVVLLPICMNILPVFTFWPFSEDGFTLRGMMRRFI